MNRVFKYLLFCMLFSMIACKSSTPSNISAVVSSEEESNRIFFAFPDCIESSCKDSDKSTELEKSPFVRNVTDIIDNATKSVKFSMYTFSNKNIYKSLAKAADRGVEISGIVDIGQFRGVEKLCTSVGCDFDNIQKLIDTTNQQIADLKVANPATEKERSRNQSKLKAYESSLKKYVAIKKLFDSQEFVSKSPLQRIEYLDTTRIQDLSGTSKTMTLALAFHKQSGISHVIKPAPGKSRIVHNKLIMVDSKVLMTGSGNWSSTGLSINLENQFITRDPSTVAAFECMISAFMKERINFSSDVLRCQTEKIGFSPSSKERNGNNRPENLIVDAISKSEKSVEISMHHLTLSKVYDALSKALDKNVTVRVMFDDDDCNSHLDSKTTSLLEGIVSKGAEVRYFPTNCKIFQLSHNKFGIFDGKMVVNGSGNWSKAGTTKNYENFLRIEDAQTVSGFVDFYKKAWERAKTSQQCKCDKNTTECRERYCLDRSF